MEKTFNPAEVEGRIAASWDEAGAFRAGRPGREDAEPYCIVIPPPNVTGSLHMGHALNNTLQDILCRFERMRGKDVLWQPGTDHAGIATQMVVERKLAAAGKPGRRDMGREAFLKEVWTWKEESGGIIVNQLKRLGASCDWSRERFTMDEGLSRAVLEIFVRLFEAGLIYKDKRLVNWDPKLLTAISDLEVVQEEKRGSFKWERGAKDADGNAVPFNAAALAKLLDKEPAGHLYYFDYPLADGTGIITVATTRPETMLGDTAIAVHPENENLKHLIGRQAKLPLVGRLIPIVADDYADPEKGTGAVKITPAHDFNDFEVGARHALERINMLDAEGRIVAEDWVPAAYRGLDRYAARKTIINDIHALGLLAKIEPTTHTVPHGDRSNVAIEPWLTDQWYVNVKPLAERGLAAVRAGETKFIPTNWEKTYFDWLENIQPWCISRQLWWGHQIPAWYGPDGDFVVARNEAEAADKARAKWGKDVPLKRDEDVLDTWFSSALWPYSTLGWPDATPELKKFYPTSVLVTGFDIIFFWVARMMMTGLFIMDEVPFHDVYIHALVRDEKGQKMSKSKGNVIDPLDLINKFGADALRFTLAAFAAQGRDVKMSESRVEGYRNFGTKLWNATRFAEMNGCLRMAGFDPKAVTLTLSRWIIGETARAEREIREAILAYRFNDAAGAAYRFVWNVLCDWHLELAKPILQGEDSPAKDEIRAVTAWVLDQAMTLLHPFMPFITEELWRVTGENGPARANLLVLTDWPDFSGLEDAAAEAEIGWLVDLVTAIRSVRAEVNVPPATLVPLVLVVGAETRARVGRQLDALKRLARLSDVAFADAPPASGAVQIVVRGEVAALPLEGVIDIGAEKARLAKELGKIDGEISRFDAKLGNADFLARAPEEVVEEQREKREEAVARKAKIAEALKQLGA